ncbi:MAG: hypothetical protein GY696_21480 [Gammaproteobacteria bacterium]|nr:hypothetical protein [Gammaproteobacteria bacterium]
MNRTKIYIASLLIVSAFTLTACGGGDSTTTSNTVTTTLGQELEDLDAAHKKGILSDSEYEKAKESLIKSRN